MQLRKLIFFLLFKVLFSNTIHIPADYNSIQEGINNSVDYDTILVQEGIYYENIDFIGKNVVVGSLFLLYNDSTLIGNTILDGSGIGSVVSFLNGETNQAQLIGFTIQNGQGYAFSNYHFGGGITCQFNSNPTLNHLIVRQNLSLKGGGIKLGNFCSPIILNSIIENNIAQNNTQSHGGGIHSSYCSPLISNVIISNNFASNHAGGMYINGGSPILNNVSFINNSSNNNGGGIGASNTDAELLDVIISDNNCGGNGGGMFCYGNANLILENVFFENNSSGFNGGGLSIYLSDVSLHNGIIFNNSAGFGGGISIENSSSLILENSNIKFNVSNDYGGGIFMSQSSLEASYLLLHDNQAEVGGGISSSDTPSNIELINSTITQNYALVNFGSIHGTGAGNSQLILENSIIWGNYPPEYCLSSYVIDIRYSNIEGGLENSYCNYNGIFYDNNFDVDPIFINPEQDIFNLSYYSPCVDAGNPFSPLDEDGSFADIGAFVFSFDEFCENGIQGDLNFDGDINITDIINIVNCIIMFNCPVDYSCEFWISDVNEDLQINVLDIIEMILIILES